jgi:RNA polymerase sigma-70 factor (ECF subfamily)
MDEKTLIAGCVKGDAKAQKALFDKFASKMMVVCMRYFPNKMEAEDILQEGFVKIFQKIENYKFDGSFEGWMKRVFANTALDEIRRRKTILEEQDVSEYSYKIFNNSSTDENLRADDLLKMIQALPVVYRVVFNMFAIEGYSHKEIAEILDISENTSKSQFFRAKALLKAQLEKIEFER